MLVVLPYLLSYSRKNIMTLERFTQRGKIVMKMPAVPQNWAVKQSSKRPRSSAENKLD